MSQVTRGVRRRGGRRSVNVVLLLAIVLATGLVATAFQDQRRRGEGAEALEERGDRFGRMFLLPPFALPTLAVTKALETLGQRGGLMDAGDQLAAGPLQLIVDPALNTNNPNNASHTAGTTFMGQFLDHDMTFDTTSRLGRPADPRRSRRTGAIPYFDLDSVYGDGPRDRPQLYNPDDRAKFRVESGGMFEDLPRDGSMRAIIADPRNDETVIIAGSRPRSCSFHNKVVDRLRLGGSVASTRKTPSRAARELTTWHYQWLIVHEFLPLFVGQPMVDSVVNQGPRFFRPRLNRAFIPVEFQMAYRFGHSLVRPSYRANFTGVAGAPFFAMIFDTSVSPAHRSGRTCAAARGRRGASWAGRPSSRFPGLEADVRPNKRIDTRLSTPLFDLPLGAIASGSRRRRWPQRNLLRHLTGPAVGPGDRPGDGRAGARRPSNSPTWRAVHPPFVRSTPLWFYVLREADVIGRRWAARAGGRAHRGRGVHRPAARRLRFVSCTRRAGSRPRSGPTPGQFRMIDFLNFAGVGGHR